MRAMNVIVLASLNRGKQEEFQGLLKKFHLQLGHIENYVRNADFLETVESHDASATYLSNAKAKCRAAFGAAKLPTLADDSGLEIDALDGEPGIDSAHYARTKAAQSQSAANRHKVLDALKGKSNRKARMRCVLVFEMEGVLLHAEGVCDGTIATKDEGNGGFGYDSIFIPQGGRGKTFAEMSEEEKNVLSHRALALDELMRLIKERELQFVRP